MPHILIDYSANLDQLVDLNQVCNALLKEATQIDAFPMAGVRVRAVRVDHYAIADGNPDHAYLDMSIRLREGRSSDVKKDALMRLFSVAEKCLADAMTHHPIALSAEIREISDAFSAKTGTIRNHLGVSG